MNVTVTLTAYPAKGLLDLLTAPIPTEAGVGSLSRVPMTVGSSATVLAGAVPGTLDELAAFFKGIPTSAYGATQGIVCVEGAQPGIVVNRIGWIPA